jgi:hypothetical protein
MKKKPCICFKLSENEILKFYEFKGQATVTQYERLLILPGTINKRWNRGFQPFFVSRNPYWIIIFIGGTRRERIRLKPD